MRRVVILGCAGCGKTTLARTMGERSAVPVVHLDTLSSLPGWEPRDPGAFREKLAAAIAGDAWVTEGHPWHLRNFGDTLDLCVPRADLVLFVHQPRWLRLWRVIRRWLTDRGRTRPDLAEGCAEHLDWPSLKWIWTFEHQVRPAAEQALAAYATPVVHLNGDRDIAGFLDGLMSRTDASTLLGEPSKDVAPSREAVTVCMDAAKRQSVGATEFSRAASGSGVAGASERGGWCAAPGWGWASGTRSRPPRWPRTN